jgi:hypothetical protein
LSDNIGSFWKLSKFDPYLLQSKTIYPEMLIEITPTNNSARFDGEYHMNISFTIGKYLAAWAINGYYLKTSFDYGTVIYLDNRI